MSSRDFDFDTQVQPQNKIDFKKVFFNPEQGLNIVRISNLNGKAFKTHFTKTAKGEKKFIKCPGAGCPLCVGDEKAGIPAARPATRYLLKVISRKDNTLKVWEFGQQIKTAIEEFVKEIKENVAAGRSDAEDKLTDYNIEVRRRAPGTNPLYSLSVKERLTTDDRYKATLANDAQVIAADTINLQDLLKPWSVERINTQVLGLPEGATSSAGSATPAPAPAARTASTQTAVVAKPNVQALAAAASAAGDDGDDWLK